MRFSDAAPILDSYHLAEHISKCSNEMFGEATQESRQWAGRMRQIMRKGKVDQALKEVEKLPGGARKRREAKHELITYLTNPAVGGTSAWTILATVVWGCGLAAGRWRLSVKCWCKPDANNPECDGAKEGQGRCYGCGAPCGTAASIPYGITPDNRSLSGTDAASDTRENRPLKMPRLRGHTRRKCWTGSLSEISLCVDQYLQMNCKME